MRAVAKIFLSTYKREKTVAMKAETIYLQPSQRLAAVQKESHARKRDGKDIAYVIFDRSGKIAHLTQKLPAVTEFINTHLISADYEKVNTVGLWEILNQTGGRVFLFLHTDDFWRDYHAMRAKGIQFIREPKEAEYGTVAVFTDLYGNLWDLLQLKEGHPVRQRLGES